MSRERTVSEEGNKDTVVAQDEMAEEETKEKTVKKENVKK